MTTSQLVPVVPGIIGNINCLTINGRILHHVLKVKRDFSTWITGRIKKYGFVEGQDFEIFFPQTGENSERGRPSQEYTLTTDMGKELCMVENNEAGRVARRYFIECERALIEGVHGEPIALTPSTTADRLPLRAIVHAWSLAANQPHQALWPQVKAHFQLSRIDDLPVEWIPDALAFVQGKIDALPKALPEATLTPNRIIQAVDTGLEYSLYEFDSRCKSALDVAGRISAWFQVYSSRFFSASPPPDHTPVSAGIRPQLPDPLRPDFPAGLASVFPQYRGRPRFCFADRLVSLCLSPELNFCSEFILRRG